MKQIRSPPALKGREEEQRTAPKDCKPPGVKYLNEAVDQAHRFIRKKVRAA